MFDFYGAFTYPAGKTPAGTVTQFTETLNGSTVVTYSGLNTPMATLVGWIDTANNGAILNAAVGGDNTLVGSQLADVLRGGAGDDILFGRGGNDVLDGSLGNDTAVFTGRYQDYSLVDRPDGTIGITDLRAGSPDGTDTLISIEQLQFADRTESMASPSPTAPTVIAFVNVLRDGMIGVSAITLNDMLAQVNANQLTNAAALNQIKGLAGATTSVATLSYEFFTGSTPSSAGYDYLVAPTGPNANNLNSTYYQSFNLENRYINFAVNLGKLGAGAASFQAQYGSMTLFNATKAAYTTIFGGTPTDAKVHALIDSRVSYFGYYGQDDGTGIGSKAAMVGWLIAEAVKADTGMYAKANDAFMSDLAQGLGYKVDLVGVYGNSSFIVSN